jgi:hypothetical protein
VGVAVELGLDLLGLAGEDGSEEGGVDAGAGGRGG